MKLRYITLWGYYDIANSLGEEFRTKFNDNCNFICNYLSKAVRKLNIETSEFNMLGIELSNSEDCVHLSNTDKSLRVKIKFTQADKEEYLNNKNLKSRFEYYLSLIEKGYKMAVSAGYSEICIVKLLQIHKMFRKNNYKNEWLWKKKQLKNNGIYVYFKCHLTTFDFRFELEIYNLKKTKILNHCILLQTPPNEFCYSKDIRKLKITNSELIILDFLDKPKIIIDLTSIMNDNICFQTFEDIKILSRWKKEIEDIKW